MTMVKLRRLSWLSLSLFAVAAASQAAPQEPAVNDVPTEFSPKVFEKNYSLRVEMIPMRDGVKLKTLIFLPKGAKAAPMLLQRTPYNASRYEAHAQADSLMREGFIRVYQDIRGKYGSEGNYVVTMPVRGPLNPAATDHVTDTWDSIEWLVKNVTESNGRVAMLGNSYDGFTTAMALLDPHPALKAAVPVGPLLDAWMGDDWFHYGAFRQMMLGYVHMQTGQRGEGMIAPSEIYDKYEEFLRAGSVSGYAASNGLDQLPYVERLLEHPAYDAYWQGLAVDKLIVARPSKVPTLWTQGLWDQEDMYGANHVWRALKAAGHEANNWLVLGPWNHVQAWGGGTSIGPIKWPTDTSYQWTNEMLLPFLNEHLRNGPPANLPRVTVYNSGEKRWDRFTTWPTACEQGCATKLQPLFLTENFGLSFEHPAQPKGGDTYTSDPATPVPFLPRPVVDPFGDFASGGGLGSAYEPWSKWLSTDQRFVAGRPDVLVYETEVLTEAVRVQGVPVADVRAMTTGTDGDFVVKLIDVYPAKDYSNPGASGYQLPIATDIFRGRYRNSFEHPTAIPANKAQQYKFELPNVNHVFQPGHRIMVQIQSTLFPLYDRNPQTFVPNIFKAKPADYKKADVTILRSKAQPTAILLPVVK
ncbi:MAG TPA: CocE/NonD family hydrolase [Steroidobacter sp.]